MLPAVPRVELSSRSEALLLRGNERKERGRAALLLPLADLALAGGFQRTKEKAEALMTTPLTIKQTKLLGELVTAVVEDTQQRQQPGLDSVVLGELDIEEWLRHL
jgi:hypothetical protein